MTAELFPQNQNEKELTTRQAEPLLFQLRETVEELPGTTYMTNSTGCAGREDEYDDA